MKRTTNFLGGLIITAFLLIAGSPVKAPLPNNLTVYWIDTEGGGATLIVTPAGESILIDTGNPGGRDSERIFDVAHNVAGLKQIDHLLITHWHNDHFGGAAMLAAKMPIIEVIDRGIADSLLNDANFAKAITPYREMKVAHRTLFKAGGGINLRKMPRGFQKLSFSFVGANRQFQPIVQSSASTAGCDTIREKGFDKSDNANSTVLVMDYGPFRFFDGGDLTWNVEKTLVCPQNIVGTVDVFQVNHHGLDLSNNPLLIKALAPTVSIMGNGPKKGGGPETITTLSNTPGIQARYQLHKNVRADSSFNTSDEYIANMKADCVANYVKMTVAPDGKRYTVSIPANKHERTFDTKTTH